MKYYGTISDPKDMVTKEYVDSKVGSGSGGSAEMELPSIYTDATTSKNTLYWGTWSDDTTT